MPKPNFISFLIHFLVLSSCVLLCSNLLSCKSEVLKTEYDTEMIVNVVDEDNKPLKNVRISVFYNLEDYTKSIAARSPINAFKTQNTDANGKLQFDDLLADRDTWIAAFYEDTTKFKGFKILYDNDEVNYEAIEKFRKGSINEISIKIIPADGIVSFKLSSAFVSTTQFALPVIYTLRSDTGRIRDLNDSILKVTRKGKQGWYARSFECDWSGVVDVQAGKKVEIQLPPCEKGTAGFYSLDLNATSYPIYVRFVPSPNVFDTVAILYNFTSDSLLATDCNQIDNVEGVSFPKGVGRYNYDAISEDGNCRWVGSINVVRGACTIQKLNNCR